MRILSFLCVFGVLQFSAQKVGGAEKEIDWREVHAEMRDQLKAVTQTVSDILRVRPHEVNYHRNGSDSFPYLSSRDYDHSFVASFTLRGVDKAAKQIPPEAKTRRDDEYGNTLFILRVRNLKRLPPEEALTEMLEGRRLAEARHALEMRSFWVRYNLVQGTNELKKRVDSLAKQARSAKDPNTRKVLNAKAKAQQQANQREIKTAGETAKKQLEQIQPNLASAKEREKEWQTAQQLRLLDARESQLRLELAIRRQKYEESVTRLRENATVNPKLQQNLGSRLASLEESFGRFETGTNKQLEEISNKRAGMKGERVVKKSPTEGRVADRRAQDFFGRSRRRKLGTLRGARLSLNYHPGPSKLKSKAFSVSTGEGLVLEVDSLQRRSLRSIEYHWPCGRYLVSVTASVQRSILERAKRYDGQHRRVPFLQRRLEQAEAVKSSVAQRLNRSGLCDQNDGYWPWTKTYAAKAEENKSRIDEIKSQLDMLAKEKAAKREEWLELLRESLQRALPGEGTTILGQRVVKARKELRDRLRTDIRARHEEQRGLI